MSENNMDRKIIEALESCRPKHDDMTAPEMDSVAREIASNTNLKAFAESVRSLDTKITDAVQHVPLPDGLQERLLESLRLAATTHDASASLEASELAMPTGRNQPEPQRAYDRRKWFFAGVGFLGMAVSLAIAFLSVWSAFEKETSEQLLVWATNLRQTVLNDSYTDWDAPSATDLSLLPQRDFKSAPIGHQRLNGFDLFVFEGGRRFLFVKRANALSDVPNSPPTPTLLSNDWRYGIWKSQNHVFVVYVQGNDNDYFNIVNAVKKPMA